MITGILIAAGIVGAIGILIGLFLGIAGIKFRVEIDPREEAVLGVLPGNNCGGCGYAGCSGLAAAIAKGRLPPMPVPWEARAWERRWPVLWAWRPRARSLWWPLCIVRGIVTEPVRTINTAAWRIAVCCPLCRGRP